MGNMEAVLNSLEHGMPVLLTQLGLTLLIWLAACGLDGLLTPHHRLSAIRTGNVAVAVSAGSTALAIAIPLGACLSGSVNNWDILLWGVAITLIQILAFWVANLMIHNLGERLDHGDMAAAIFLAFVRLGFGCINAAAISA